MTFQDHYLRLYREADEILKRPGNPCNIQPAGDGRFTCTEYKQPSKELCCIGCKHLGPNGCTVQSLSCKLAWCFVSHSSITGQTVEEHPVFVEIKKLRDEAIALGVPLRHRLSYEETFRRGSKEQT